jgi:hypothetical protein
MMRRSNWSLRKIGRLGKRDILDAFKIVAYEIRAKCKRYSTQKLTQADACQLALRIRDQRELVRQLVDPRNPRHAKCLLRLNGKYRRDLIELVEKAGLDTKILVFK